MAGSQIGLGPAFGWLLPDTNAFDPRPVKTGLFFMRGYCFSLSVSVARNKLSIISVSLLSNL